MALMELTAEYKDRKKPPKAEVILRAATKVLKLLRTLEKEHNGKAAIPWEIGVAMYQSRAVITINAPVKNDQARNIGEQLERQGLPNLGQ